MSTESLLGPLLALITESTRELQNQLNASGLPEPWLSKPELHPWDEHTPPPKYWEARKVLLSALGMMIAVVQNPKERVVCDSMMYHQPSALNFVARTHISDILAEDGVDPVNGLHVDVLSKRTGVAAKKIERVLRYLCNFHFFEERGPNMFANNRLSVTLRNTEPTRGFAITWSDLSMKAATKFTSVFADPVKSQSQAWTESPFAEAFNPDEGPKETDYWKYIHRPENEEYRINFAKGMHAMEVMNGASGYLDFDWGRFDEPGAIFVESGSGIGHLSLGVLPVLRHASFENQDLTDVCEQGMKMFAEKNPDALDSNRVTFRSVDFFKEQPVKGAAIYVLSNVIHDWEDSKALKILEHISNAMSDDSTLVVLEVVVMPALAQHHTEPGFAKSDRVDIAPYPLLQYYGTANPFDNHQSLEVMTLGNALDRTLSEYTALFSLARLDLVKIHRMRKHTTILELRKAL